jgi:hypothetical protein
MDTAGGGQPLPTHKKQQCVHWRSAARSFRLPLVLGTVALLLLPGAHVAMVVSRCPSSLDTICGGSPPEAGSESRPAGPVCDRNPVLCPKAALVQPPGPSDPPHPATP